MKQFATSTRFVGRAACALLLTSVLCGGNLVSRPASAQDAQSADATEYTLKKRVFKAGEVNRYKLQMRIQLDSPNGAQDISINMRFKETTKEPKPGEFTLLNEFESALANIGGMEQDLTSFLPTVTVTRDKDGKVTTKTEGGNEQANAQVSAMFEQFASSQDNFLPKKPVKAGDKWKISVSTPGGPAGGETKVDGEATLLGTEIINSVKTLKVKINANSENKQADVKGHTESTMNIDPDTGKMLRMVAKVDAVTMGNKVNQELEMSLLGKDDKGDKPEIKKEAKKQ